MTSTILVLSCCENVKGMSATQLLNFLVIFQLCCHLFSVFKLTKKQICCSTCSLMGWCFTLWLEFVSAVSIKWSFYKVHLNCMLTFLSVLNIKLRGKKLNMCCFSLSYCLSICYRHRKISVSEIFCKIEQPICYYNWVGKHKCRIDCYCREGRG